MAKEFLDRRKVAYEAVDVSVDRAGLEELRKKSGQMGVPVIVVGGEVVVGFDQEHLETLLGPA